MSGDKLRAQIEAVIDELEARYDDAQKMREQYGDGYWLARGAAVKMCVRMLRRALEETDTCER